MTRWINLGPGIHREDPLWKIHIFDRNGGPSPDELPYSLRLQSPRTCFENSASLSFKDLRSRNMSYLRGDRYKKGKPFAYERADLVWHISYKEPSKIWITSSLFSWLGALVKSKENGISRKGIDEREENQGCCDRAIITRPIVTLFLFLCCSWLLARFFSWILIHHYPTFLHEDLPPIAGPLGVSICQKYRAFLKPRRLSTSRRPLLDVRGTEGSTE